jgi:DNA-binding MarR family transcriptional regulator
VAEAALTRTQDQARGSASAARARPRPQNFDHPFASDVVVPGAGMAGRLAHWLSALRRHQKEHFPGALGSDSSWAVLLQLYASHVYQHRVHIHTLSERTGIPGTTVLRALDSLIAAGFAARFDDRFDRRRVVVELTNAGASAMKQCLLNSRSLAELI